MMTTVRIANRFRSAIVDGSATEIDPWLEKPCCLCGEPQYLRASERRRCPDVAVTCQSCSAKVLGRKPR